jgi:phosphatidylglycerophosphate synthase
MLNSLRNKINLDNSIGKIFSFLSPNTWTFGSILTALVTFYLLTENQFIAAAGLLLVTGFLDMVDGSVARYTNKVSVKGAYLDTIVDRYVEGIVLFGLLFTTLPEIILPLYVWIFILFFGSIMTTYAKAAYKEKLGNTMQGGFLERAERIIILTAGLFLTHIDVNYLVYTIILLAMLTNSSALQRIYKGLQ